MNLGSKELGIWPSCVRNPVMQGILQGAKTHIVGQFAQSIKGNFKVELTKTQKFQPKFFSYICTLSEKNEKEEKFQLSFSEL